MHELAKSKGWWTPPKTPGEQVVMMHSELSEVIEAFRTVDGDMTTVKFIDGKPEGVPIELADVVIRIFDTCGYYGIDLLDAILMKTFYNMTRPQRHGDKKL
jgi:NTP pyrophosphatase (non-canonical NTP hydrolase)